MRRECRWGLVAAVTVTLSVVSARRYANLMAPYYSAVDRLYAVGHPWAPGTVEVKPGDQGPGYVLTSTSEIRRLPTDPYPAARTVARVQVGEAVETPLVFWTLLLLWPATSPRRQILRLGIGVPIFLELEAVTTAVQFIYTLPAVSALLAGESNPLTFLDRWSRILESGGRYVVEVVAALLAVAAADAGRINHSRRSDR